MSSVKVVDIRNVPGETNPAALFHPQQHAAFEHLRANIFEPDAGFDQRQAMRRAHLVHHRSRRERLDYPSPALPVLDQMMQQQANDLVRCERVAAAVHAAHAVGVAIGHKADVVRMAAEKFSAARVIFVNRLGIDAAEQHVVLPVERGDLAGRARE